MANTTMTVRERGTELAALVGRRVAALQHRFLQDDMTARATLAHLRQSVGKPVGTVPEVWAVTVAGLDAIENPVGDDPSRAETAAHLAMGLYAIHQRGMRSTGAHRLDRDDRPVTGLGSAVARLRPDGGSADDPVTRRFTTLVTSLSFAELSFHLRSLVTQLAGEGISLDYGRFARDLYLLQFPDSAADVQLAWAREFYRVRPVEADEPSGGQGDTTESTSTYTEGSGGNAEMGADR